MRRKTLIIVSLVIILMLSFSVIASAFTAIPVKSLRIAAKTITVSECSSYRHGGLLLWNPGSFYTIKSIL